MMRVLLVTVSILVLGAVSCSQESSAPSPSSSSSVEAPSATSVPVSTDTGHTDVLPAFYPALHFESLESMAAYFPTQLVAEVRGIGSVFYKELKPENEPTYVDPCPTPYTRISLEVERTLTDTAVGEAELTLLIQTGENKGSCERPDGEPLPRVGSRFLFLLHDYSDAGLPGYMGPRFELTDAELLRPTGWWVGYPASLDLTGVSQSELEAAWASPDPEAAVSELARVSLDEAIDKIEAARPHASESPSASPAGTPTGHAEATPIEGSAVTGGS